MRKTSSRESVPFGYKRPRTRIAATLAFSLSSLLSVAPVHALDPNKRLTQYIHTSWRIQDGSAPDGMSSITQTSDGFLWFTSSSKRMYRFDGVRFVPWTLSVDGRTIERFQTVYGDHEGGLWAVDPDGEIVHVENGRVSSHLQVEGFSGGISEDPNGSLWLAQSSYTSDTPLCRIRDQGIKCFGKADGLTLPSAGSLLADGKGGLWLGGGEAIEHWSGSQSQIYPIKALRSNPGVEVQALARDSEGYLWVGLLQQGPGKGLGRMEDGVFKSFVTQGFDGSKLAVAAIRADREGSVWVGTVGGGLYRIHGNVVEHYGRAEGLSSDAVQNLFEDREGLLWVTTSNGVDSFRDPAVTIFSASEGLTMDDVGGILAASDGTVYVANGDALDWIRANGKISSIRWGKGLPGDQVFGMFQDRAGNLWMGSGDGLYLFQGGRFRRIPEPGRKPLGVVMEIAEDTDGNLWATVLSNPPKLIRIRDFQIQEEVPRSKVPLGRLAVDPRGGIWFATPNGELVLFRRGDVQRIATDAKGPANYVRAQADGSVLAAYGDGLVGLRDGKVQRMTTKNGLPCNFIYGFVQDKQKQWWINSECGIVRLADSEMQRWWADSQAVLHTRVYDQLDGARPGHATFDPAALSPDGRVWFAGGVVQMLDPSTILSQKALPADTYVESITVDRKQFAVKDKIPIPPHPRDLQIDYTSPTFLIPQRVKFRYRLEGYDHSWHDAGTLRQAFYTDLPPGKFSFRVIASNSDGVWDDTPATLDFSVAPAYYQTNWFRALCVAGFVALLWALHQWRLRRLQHDFEVTLGARVSERTRIARELHDTLLQSFHGVLLRFQTAFQLLPERPIDAKENLGSAIEQAAEAITEGRDAVQGLRDSTVEGNDLARAISTLGEELASDSTDNSTEFRVAVEGKLQNLHPIKRDEIYKISAEALRNCFRHSGAKQVEVELRYDNEEFRLRVRDDGKGVDRALIEGHGREGHFGMRGMRERAILIGGKLTVWSEIDAGTEVELRIPASSAYVSGRRGSWFSRRFVAKAKSS